MADAADIVITGAGALCAAGKQPGEIWDAVRSGRSALSPIQQWDSSEWPRRIAGEIPDLDPVALLRDRKIQKLIRRSDVFGLYAADQAIEASRLTAHRDTLDETGRGRVQRPHRRLCRLRGRQLLEPVRLLSAAHFGGGRSAGLRARAGRYRESRCGC